MNDFKEGDKVFYVKTDDCGGIYEGVIQRKDDILTNNYYIEDSISHESIMKNKKRIFKTKSEAIVYLKKELQPQIEEMEEVIESCTNHLNYYKSVWESLNKEKGD